MIIIAPTQNQQFNNPTPAEIAYLYKSKTKFMGITFDIEKQRFQFDFEHDGTSDLITLTGSGYQVEAFGKCFYYGYEFEPEVDSSVRTNFIQYVKFSSSIQKDENLSHFIQKAINDLSDKIDLYDYDLVIYPESSSQVNQYMLRYIYRFAQPTLRTYGTVLQSTTVEGGMLCSTIKNSNVLVIDDITTSGSTLNEILRALRILNEDNSITIFSLIGRKNLMAEVG